MEENLSSEVTAREGSSWKPSIRYLFVFGRLHNEFIYHFLAPVFKIFNLLLKFSHKLIAAFLVAVYDGKSELSSTVVQVDVLGRR